MGWFSRRRKEDATAPAGETRAAPAVASSNGADFALDTLASVVRSYGKYGFETKNMGQAQLERRCDAWARHVSNGAPAPVGALAEDEEGVDGDVGDEAPQQLAPLTLEQRSWPDLQQFFVGHRRDEQRAVLSAADNMRGLISEMTRCLREAVADDAAKDRDVATELAEMNIAVNSGSLDEIQARFARMMLNVTEILEERRRRQEAQLSELAEAVHELRGDLMAARTEARIDALTQLNNRGAFDEVFSKQVDYAFLSGQPLALVMIDLDHFKAVNDTYGHQFGDEVLQATGKALVRSLPRSSDFIARYGGEEFAVLLMDISPDRVTSLVNRILDSIRVMPLEHADDPVKVTASAGVAIYSPDMNADAFLKFADDALYEAKSRGRNRAILHTELIARAAA